MLSIQSIVLAASFLLAVVMAPTNSSSSSLAAAADKHISPPPQLAPRSIESREACHGLSMRSEHLSGVCMFHYECQQQYGVPIGSCVHNQLVGSCCVLPPLRRPPPPPPSLSSLFLLKQSKHIPSASAEGNKLTSEIGLSKANNNITTTSGHTPPPSSTLPSSTSPITLVSSSSTTTTTKAAMTPKLVDSSTSSLNSLWTTLSMLNTSSTFLFPSTSPTPSVPPALVISQMDPFTHIFPPMTSSSPENPLVGSNSIEDVFSNHFPINTVTSSTVKPTKQTTTTSSTTKITSTIASTKKVSTTTTTTTTTRAPTTTARSTTTTTTTPKSKLPACGVRPMRPTGRVVGGRNAKFGEWPWHVLIKETTWLGFFTKPKCGGVLIDPKFVLTAAHCQPGMLGQMLVMLGQHDMNGEAQRIKPTIKTVRRMIVHRDYNPETFDNDIALLELDTPFESKPHIMPICLPTKEENYVGKHAYVSGFGKLSYGGMVPNILQTVQLPIIDNQNCQKMFMNAGHLKYIRDQFLCAGSPGKDSCEGDSGGPLMMERDGVWTLIGTVSHGIKCAEPNMPGVYMKIFSYLSWIRNIMDKSY